MAGEARVVAVLGPTNTGKTTYAIERMLGHRTGVIGLPLRLLAREVYDRIVALRGPSVVALVTGEERIVPPRTQYWVCTVEAMPEGMGCGFRRGRRNPALRRSGARSCLYRPSAAGAGPARDAVSGVRHHARPDCGAGARGAVHAPRADVRIDLFGPEKDKPDAAAQRNRRVFG